MEHRRGWQKRSHHASFHSFVRIIFFLTAAMHAKNFKNVVKVSSLKIGGKNTIISVRLVRVAVSHPIHSIN